MGERFLDVEEVAGSIPAAPTIYRYRSRGLALLHIHQPSSAAPLLGSKRAATAPEGMLVPPLLVSPPRRVEERLAVGVVRPSQVTKVTLTRGPEGGRSSGSRASDFGVLAAGSGPDIRDDQG